MDQVTIAWDLAKWTLAVTSGLILIAARTWWVGRRDRRRGWEALSNILLHEDDGDHAKSVVLAVALALRETMTRSTCPRIETHLWDDDLWLHLTKDLLVSSPSYAAHFWVLLCKVKNFNESIKNLNKLSDELERYNVNHPNAEEKNGTRPMIDALIRRRLVSVAKTAVSMYESKFAALEAIGSESDVLDNRKADIDIARESASQLGEVLIEIEKLSAGSADSIDMRQDLT